MTHVSCPTNIVRSFVICNEGYTIERYIHGWEAVYNDIQPWDFLNIPVAFGAKDKYKGYKVTTRDELRELFANEEFASAPCLQVGFISFTPVGKVSVVLTKAVG